ncbi:MULTISPECIES: ClpXP protease specificity-enhancing factor [unclassified Herbaspirillum]|uniref:ClpXP protease specificity-enhancing factor n=1 Tax=unclassified Herbaspirillum TaxID=2624150 RepID=UPI001154196C|nr:MULTISPECIES: ClpXP protease specificity-enhancing factor [unclassified Herbaspirillum]MBB5390408.1 stringent starvation protein B [Herbaspirillum sp. SJZ102]TQK09095.1 stringent starvation protein B [Herbaspirillum sp. SJZ130]TQK14218.1 stringent starvation protein B [Herbaspirillum sp. SJZ106]
MPEVSTKPYLLRAIYEWCTDNGFTPHIAVVVDSHTRVPMQFVKNGEIVLNISFEATSGLKMENDSIRFSARFGGVSRDILIPVENVIAIYARENGQGMAFEAPNLDTAPGEAEQDSEKDGGAPMLSSVPVSEPEKKPATTEAPGDDDPEPPKKGGRPVLTRIK